MFKPSKAIVHHSATVDGETFSTGAIRRYHIEENGWVDIGYHVLIELVKSGHTSDYEIILGRSWNVPGAHTSGHNNDSLGICFVGDYDKGEPSKEMLLTGARAIRLWMNLFRISANDIYAHNYFNPHKSCPGKKFPMAKLKSLLR